MTTEHEAEERPMPWMDAVEWELALKRVSQPLPGSVAKDNLRPVNVPGVWAGRRLLDALVGIFPHITGEEWQRRIEAGRFLGRKGEVLGGDYRVKSGDQLRQLFPDEIEAAVSSEIRVVYADEDVLLLHKPAPLPMHPCGRYNRNTLHHWFRLAVPERVVRPVHRLDANTTGLVVFALNLQANQVLQQQFLSARVEKTYLVAVEGSPPETEFISNQKIARQPSRTGVREVDDEGGQEALTRFEVIKRSAAGQSLLMARLGTGRTNQIRAHLWAMNYPVVGDPSYLDQGEIGGLQTLGVDDPALCLHAWKLGWDHPRTGQRMAFETEMPEWARRIMADQRA